MDKKTAKLMKDVYRAINEVRTTCRAEGFSFGLEMADEAYEAAQKLDKHLKTILPAEDESK